MHGVHHKDHVHQHEGGVILPGEEGFSGSEMSSEPGSSADTDSSDSEGTATKKMARKMQWRKQQ